MIGIADFHRAVVSLWKQEGLDVPFKNHWAVPADAEVRRVLHDTEASPGQPFPYCVFEVNEPNTKARSTGGQADRRGREYRTYNLTFNIHTRDAGNSPAKNLAVSLCESIISVFGGHPTCVPKNLSLTHGDVLNCRYERDVGVKTGEQEWQWVITYSVEVDIPVKFE